MSRTRRWCTYAERSSAFAVRSTASHSNTPSSRRRIDYLSNEAGVLLSERDQLLEELGLLRDALPGLEATVQDSAQRAEQLASATVDYDVARAEVEERQVSSRSAKPATPNVVASSNSDRARSNSA